MQSEAEVKQEGEVDASSPKPNTPSAPNTANAPVAPQSNGKATGAQNGIPNAQHPPPKTDKPRPHVCNTCGRSFARLEHLKRHERSHTKEKPFECPECTRCFARRDLLLRHQQKLHMTNTTTVRGPRSGRRESVSGAVVGGGAKVRKNSVANANVGGLASNTMRPRANTISDLGSLGLNDNMPRIGRMNSNGPGAGHMMHGGMHNPMALDYRGMPGLLGHHGNMHGLPKLDTSINSADISNSLRTAPPQATFGEFDLDQIFAPHNTINPAALHFPGASTMAPSGMNLGAFDVTFNQQMAVDDDFSWMRNWSGQFPTGFENEQAIDESSPSRMSSGDSPGDHNDNMANGGMGIPIHNGMQWQQPDAPMQHNLNFQLDNLGSGLENMEASGDTVSPSRLHDPTPTAEAYFHQAMMQHNGIQQSPQIHHQHQHQHQQQQQHTQQQQQQQQQNHLQQHPAPLMIQTPSDLISQGHNSQYVGQALSNFGSDSPSISSSSMTGSARQSSVTSMSTDSITDSTRQALLTSLSQPSVFTAQSARKFSQPSVSSPLSPSNARMITSSQGPTLPSTADIKRYVGAFVRCAHPHLPVVHIPTLSFDTIEGPGSPQGSGSGSDASNGQPSGGGGARCLILGMAAIGALYEYDHPASKELFEAAKKMISLYLEERRRADLSAAGSGSGVGGGESPLWLVQAMLLTVIYGHHCGDRTLADIASNHIAALVSLARAANLHGSHSKGDSDPAIRAQSADLELGSSPMGVPSPQRNDLHGQWYTWKLGEERKRVVYAIFILSSLLTTAYNQPPTIMNSEIKLDLPCSEDLYNAETAEEWQNRGGLTPEERNTTSFAVALSTLLTARERQSNSTAQTQFGGAINGMANGEGHGVADLKPSTFGCLVLINALHNYIWETRTRHGGGWTTQETEAMFAHIEPALNAWQIAWKSNEHHKLERPNKFGLGPLSADSIPLLDLAFVRLFVNLGQTAEAFWRRDFDAMAEQLALGSDAKTAAVPNDDGTLNGTVGLAGNSPGLSNGIRTAGDAVSRRERYLRKAAFYAADSLMIACDLNLTYTDATAHELPIQSAICFFDCAQVLGEWLTSVQERVGRFLGVIGRDPTDYTQVPAIMMLETEDVVLLQKVEQICASLEQKRQQHEDLSVLSADIHNSFSPNPTPAPAPAPARSTADLSSCGLGGRIMRSVAMMLEKAVIWPILHVMAKALEVEATHMERRTEASCTP